MCGDADGEAVDRLMVIKVLMSVLVTMMCGGDFGDSGAGDGMRATTVMKMVEVVMVVHVVVPVVVVVASMVVVLGMNSRMIKMAVM